MSPPTLRTTRTPSARARAESTPFVTPQGTPHTRKRRREAAQSLVELSTVDEVEVVSSPEEGDEAGSNNEEDLDIDERMNQQSYETQWRLLDHKQKNIKAHAVLCNGRDNVFDKVEQWAFYDAVKRFSTISRITFKFIRQQPAAARAMDVRY